MLNTDALVDISWSLSAALALTGAIHLIGPRWLRNAYRRWQYPRQFHRVIGVLNLVAAAFLANGETRIWGVMLTAPIAFGAAVTLLGHRQYWLAVPSILILAALPPTLLTVTV